MQVVYPLQIMQITRQSLVRVVEASKYHLPGCKQVDALVYKPREGGWGSKMASSVRCASSSKGSAFEVDTKALAWD